MFKSHENTAVDAVILCLAVCISDIRNKAGVCGTSVLYIMSQPCSEFIGQEQTNTAVPREAQIYTK